MMSYKPRCCNKDVSSDRSSLDVRNASVISDLLDSIRKETTERRMNVSALLKWTQGRSSGSKRRYLRQKRGRVNMI